MHNLYRIFKTALSIVLVLVLFTNSGQTQTLLESFTDADFTSSPAWSGSTGSWSVATSSDAAAGATNSNTLRLNFTTSSAGTQYLSTQISDWGSAQEWGFWVGRRSQAFTAANQMYIWLYANEANLTSATVDGYRIAIGDDSGGDDLRLEYIVNGAVSATVYSSAGSLTNAVTDVGFLLRVTRSSTGAWAVFTSTLPTTSGNGAIATDIPNSTNASTSAASGTTNNTLAPASNGYLGVAALHSSGATARVAVELDQIYFSAISTPTTTSISPTNANAGGSAFTLTVNGTNFISGLSTVTWGGANRTTTFVSSTQLTASISAGDIATAGTVNVGVTTTGAASSSNTQTFTINGVPTITPSLASLDLGNTVAGNGSGDYTYTVTGSNLTNDLVITAPTNYELSLNPGGPVHIRLH